MALTMNPETQTVFFASVFGHPNAITDMVKVMVSQGVTFTTEMYTLRASYKGQQYVHSLTKGSTALMKHSVDAASMEQNKQAIGGWVTQLYQQLVPSFVQAPAPVLTPATQKDHIFTVVINSVLHTTAFTGKIPVIKQIREATGLDLLQAKQLADKAEAGIDAVIKVYANKQEADNLLSKLITAGAKGYILTDGVNEKSPTVEELYAELKPSAPPFVLATKPKPVNAVIPLREAKALGQQVRGTSTGSVYYCIAYNNHVKLAARIYSKGNISIRAEWDAATPKELQKLEEAGLSMKNSYASMHLSAEEVPYTRVIGAFLMGTGLVFTDQVKAAQELITED